MNLGTLKKLARLLLQVRNPLPVLLDRQGRRAAPYIVRLFSGLRIEIRPGRGDLGAFREAWLQHDYLPPGWRIAPGDTVVDVGANVGCFTLFAAQCVGPAGRVIAIEPEAETFRQLNRNLALNRFENIVARQAAVAGREGLVELRSCTNSLYSSVFARVDDHCTDGPVQEVSAVTIEQALEEARVVRCNFLKLDCEGAEHEIIRGMSAQTAARIKRIGMELHDVEGMDGNALIRALQGFGFAVERRGVLLYARRASNAG